MKMTTTLTAAMLFGTLSLSGGLLVAADLPARGTIPFATWDADGSGTIDEQEFTNVRTQRQAESTEDGRLGRNMATAPSFTEIDGDGDGQITAEELATMQQKQWHKRGMRRGHRGGDCGMKQGMGKGYQAMDADTKQLHDAFWADTAELRKEIAMKRAEKRAVMQSANPDPDQAAQLTRELLDLRSQMIAKADEAGIDFGPAGGIGCGRGCKGQGRGGRR